jgi:Flp pilus assembly protein TadG
VTLLAAGLSLVLIVTLGELTGEVGRASALRARAQAAADAAALAAVAESAPGGGGDPAGEADRYAALNGARVVECLCEPGATAVQVRVAVDDVLADARAVLDPNALLPRSIAFDVRGLDPRLEQAVRSLVAAGRGSIRMVSGYRSPAEQSRLWTEALVRYGSPEAADDWVAPPGSSMHERGLAVDLGGDLGLAVKLVDQLHLPLWRPLSNEPWHFELVGSRG